jgi:cytochrome P450
VIAESMRLYPPAWTMGRRALASHTLGGYEIPKDSLVLTSQWVVHRDARWWDDAETFRPERWLANAGNRDPGTGNLGTEKLPDPRSRIPDPGPRPKFAYFPFGGGNRVCIGESFAWTEAILLLATIAERWSFVPVSGPRPVPRITLRPADLHMRAVRRW